MPVAELSLEPDARSAGEARRFLTTTLSSWGKNKYRDDAVLLLSELVTNAALHARTEIVIQIEFRAERLRLAVTDGSPRQPIMRHYSDQSTTGRGLTLVTALALQWGIDPHPDGSKTVWAELDTDQAARGPTEPMLEIVDLSAFPDLEEAAPGHAWGPEETMSLCRAA